MDNSVIQKTTLKAITSALLLLSAHSVFAQTINEVIEQTIRTNPQVIADVNHRLASKEQVSQAESGYYPKLDVNLGIGKEITDGPATNFENKTLTRTEVGIALTQMLYDGYRTKTSIDSAESIYEANRYQIANISEDIGFITARSYLDVLRNQQLLDVAQSNVTAHESVTDQIRLRANSGVGRLSEIEQSEARLALSQSNLFAAEGNFIDAKTTYAEVVGSFPEDLEVDESCCDNVPTSLEEALAIAMENHPLLKLNNKQFEASMADINIAKSAYHPTINFEIEGNSDHDIDGVKGMNKDLLAMFRLRYNLYNGGADSAKIDQHEYLSKQQKEFVLGTERDVEEGVRLAWNALSNASQRLPYLKVHSDSAKDTLDAYKQQFNLGQRTLLDLLDQENEMFTAETDYINGIYDEKIACYRLLYSMGVLVDTLGIQPVDVDESVVTENTVTE